MGQPITVVEKRSSNRGVLRFETNRPLSGMGHERYTQAPSELLDKMPDVLARRLFEADQGVEAVHINGSMVTVTLGRGHAGEGLGDVVRRLFLHYGDQPGATVNPPTDDGDRAPDMTADPGDTPAARNAAEPAAADPPAPEAATRPDAATTESTADTLAGDSAATTGDDTAANAGPAAEAVTPTADSPSDSPATADAAAPADSDPAPDEPTS
jgi:hypothetical protein